MDTARRCCFCAEETVTGIQLPHCQFSMNSQVLWDAFCVEFTPRVLQSMLQNRFYANLSIGKFGNYTLDSLSGLLN